MPLEPRTHRTRRSRTPQRQAAREAVTNDPAAKQIIGDRRVTFDFTAENVWIGDCDQTLGTVETVELDRPATGTVDHPDWRCVNDITETGVYRTNFDGLHQLILFVDVRGLATGSPARVAAIHVSYPGDRRVAAAPYPDEGLSCRNGD